jgi:hypothetical protein
MPSEGSGTLSAEQDQCHVKERKSGKENKGGPADPDGPGDGRFSCYWVGFCCRGVDISRNAYETCELGMVRQRSKSIAWIGTDLGLARQSTLAQSP